MHLLALLGLLWQVSLFFIHFNGETPTPSNTWSLKKASLLGRAYPYGQSLYTDVLLFFSFFSKTSTNSRAKQARENEGGGRELEK